MNFTKSLATLALASVGLPALAVTFNFTNTKPDAGTYWACTTADLCSTSGNKGAGGAFTFEGGSIDIASVTASYYTNGNWRAATVVQDDMDGSVTRNLAGTRTDNSWVGLGVYHAASGSTFSDTSDDNVTLNEKLTLVFNQSVTLTGLNLRAEGHSPFSQTSTNTFLLNGTSRYLRGDLTNVSLTGTTFTFSYGGAQANQFYLSGLTVQAVPEPDTYALMLAGIAAVGFVARRRRT